MVAYFGVLFCFMDLSFLLLRIIFSFFKSYIPEAVTSSAMLEHTNEITPATQLQNKDLAYTKMVTIGRHVHTP